MSTAALPATVPPKWAKLSRLVKDRDIQIRTKIEPIKVREYEEIISEHGHMAPLDVFVPSLDEIGTAPLLLADGFHRSSAYENLGKDKAPMEFHVGGKSEALRFAIAKNARNGLPLTNADKRRAADLAVADPVMGKMTDSAIAKLIGTSVTLVNNCRRGITPQARRERTKAENSERSSRSEKESSAPKSAVARERKTDLSSRPTKAGLLRQIEEWIRQDVLDEADVVKLFEAPKQAYAWLPKAGEITTCKLVNKSGRELLTAEVVVKSLKPDLVVFRFEGTLADLIPQS